MGIVEEVLVGDDKKEKTKKNYKMEIVWDNVLKLGFIHLYGLYGMYVIFFSISWPTFLWFYFLCSFLAFGVTAGSHRLYAHRSYKAKSPLRYLLVSLHAGMLQNDMVVWVRDHRVHHKYTDTDADPHNSTRGFFFSHMGWIMVRKHKDLKEKGKTVDISDLLEDPAVQFQVKYYYPLALIVGFVIPGLVPYLYFGEPGLTMLHAVIGRYVLSLNATWTVNSLAHIFGYKPYDRFINPTQNSFVSWLACGEGWHNYHHVFPWDYRTDEFGNYGLNNTTLFLDIMAKLGQAYDLKTVSKEMVNKRKQRTGVSSLGRSLDHGDNLWGWGDKEMKSDLIQDTKIINKLMST